MKTAAILLLSCAGLLSAQNSRSDSKPVQVVKRLASVTWDLDTHKLVWVVKTGSEVNGEFVASATNRYEVSPEAAIMASKDEERGLAAEEAGSVADLVNLLSLYCAQSTDWWEQGSPASAPATRNIAPPAGNPNNGAGEKPARVGQPEKKDPSPRLPGTLVASNAVSRK